MKDEASRLAFIFHHSSFHLHPSPYAACLDTLPGGTYDNAL
jgi:hypothetical protein